jgi:hypothetical protein
MVCAFTQRAHARLRGEASAGQPFEGRMWTLAFGQHEDRSPTHGYAASRENAMDAFAKSWRRE